MGQHWYQKYHDIYGPGLNPQPWLFEGDTLHMGMLQILRQTTWSNFRSKPHRFWIPKKKATCPYTIQYGFVWTWFDRHQLVHHYISWYISHCWCVSRDQINETSYTCDEGFIGEATSAVKSVNRGPGWRITDSKWMFFLHRYRGSAWTWLLRMGWRMARGALSDIVFIYLCICLSVCLSIDRSILSYLILSYLILSNPIQSNPNQSNLI